MVVARIIFLRPGQPRGELGPDGPQPGAREPAFLTPVALEFM